MSGADLPESLASSTSRGPTEPDRPPNLLERAAARFTAWAERWIPDAFVFALVATFVVAIAAVLVLRPKHGTLGAAGQVAEIWGSGFWELLPFTLQMALVIITGYVVATARPVYRLIARLAVGALDAARAAIAWVALFAMLSSWLNWGFSLIFSAMLARETARRIAGVDYRAVAASAFLGLGSIWAQGLSGSAALQMATPSAMQPATRAIVEAGGKVKGGDHPALATPSSSGRACCRSPSRS